MDSKLRKQGELCKNKNGQLIFICWLCNANNLDLIEVENHLKCHDSVISESEMENGSLSVRSAALIIKTEIDEASYEVDTSLQLTIHPKEILKTENKFFQEPYTKAEPNSDTEDKRGMLDVAIQSSPVHQSFDISTINPTISTKFKRPQKNEYSGHFPTFNQFKCDICNKIFERKTRIYEHLRIVHSTRRPHICNICGTRFKRVESLKDHLNRHNKIIRHTCGECGKGFFTSSNLKSHMIAHSDEKKFICTVCGKRYTSNSVLRRHERKIHRKEHTHKCDHPGCTRSFFGLIDLTIHKRTHTGERPLSCKICHKTFGMPGTLRNHINLHNPEKKYQCKFCPMKFSQWSQKGNHQKRVHTAS